MNFSLVKVKVRYLIVQQLTLAVLINCCVITAKASPNQQANLYHGFNDSTLQAVLVQHAAMRLQQAVNNPEYLLGLKHWIALPTSPTPTGKLIHLSLKDAILLALRYNPNIQSAYLDRIIQRYQLRLAHNEFELQYALAGAVGVNHNYFSGVGHSTNQTFLLSPEINLRTQYGTQVALNIENNVSAWNAYNPMLNLSITQPILRGFGLEANDVRLLDAKDNELLNKINLKQGVGDQVAEVITTYRSLILSGNNLENQRRQLVEAKKTYSINEKKIAAGQLEPTGNIQQSYQVESINLMVEQGENEFKNATQTLLQTIGLDPSLRLSVPSDVTVSQLVIPDLQQSLKQVFYSNAQYRAQKLLLRADERAYKAAKNQQLWQLDLNANAQTSTVSNVDSNNGVNGIYDGHTYNDSINLKLTIPIRDLPRNNELITAKIKLEKDKLALLALKRALTTSVTNTINTIASQARQTQLAEKQVNLARRAYTLEKKTSSRNSQLA